MTEIKLGDQVRDKHTGFTGTAVVKSEFINGCVQYTIVSRISKENKIPEELSVDEDSLELIKPKKSKPKKSTGGATRHGFKMRGY